MTIISEPRHMDQRYWTQRWINALRTTTAPQIFGQSNDDSGGRCAVGVLCDVLAEDGLAPSLGSGDFWNDEQLQTYRSCVPVFLRNEAISMNDGRRYTFHQIADSIEAHIGHAPQIALVVEAEMRELVTV